MKVSTLFLEPFDPRAGFTLFAVHVSPLCGARCVFNHESVTEKLNLST